MRARTEGTRNTDEEQEDVKRHGRRKEFTHSLGRKRGLMKFSTRDRLHETLDENTFSIEVCLSPSFHLFLLHHLEHLNTPTLPVSTSASISLSLSTSVSPSLVLLLLLLPLESSIITHSSSHLLLFIP